MVVENHYSEQQTKALVITSVIHVVIILLCIYLFNWTVPDPLPEAKVVEIELKMAGLGGDNPDAGGGGGGSKVNATSTHVSANPNIITSNNTDAPVKPVGTSNNNTKPTNPNALFSNQSDGTGNGEGDGNGNGEGPGKGNGSGGGEGNGHGPGKGNGTEAGVQAGSLEGRLLVSKPRITEHFDSEGKVVVNIWVGQDGKVTRVSINEALTLTNDSNLRRIALANARHIVWSSNPDAPVEQKGTWTVNFTLK